MSDGTTVIVAEPASGSLEIPATQAEVLATETAEAQTEAIEAVADSAVEIATIEAERDVAIAEINAEVSTAAIEANERDEEWRTETTHLRTDLAALAEAVQATATVVEQLVASLSTPQLSETPETLIVEPETVEITTSETGTETSSETRTEALAESVAESPAPLVAAMRRKVRMI